MSDDLIRLHLFPGRHLGEEEFDRIQAYTDARLAPLLATRYAGILHGLEVDLGIKVESSDGFTVRTGMGVAGNGRVLGLYYPLQQTWKELIDGYLAETLEESAVGVYYLMLRRTPAYIDAATDTDPCQRDEFDPLRDTRLETTGTLGLRRLALAEDVLDTMNREQIENLVAALHVDGEFLKSMSDTIPLGLLAVKEQDSEPVLAWFSQEAGRYLAMPNGGYNTLLNQIEMAFRRLTTEAVENK
jgi:hypothetical protein